MFFPCFVGKETEAQRVKYLAKVTQLISHRSGIRTQDLVSPWSATHAPKLQGLETNLQIAIVLLGREGGSEQPGGAEELGPGRALLSPGEGQRLL